MPTWLKPWSVQSALTSSTNRSSSVCGHNVWQKCVDKISTPCLTKADTTPGLPCWMQPAAQKCVKCRECGKETKIPPGGLATNYRLVGKWRTMHGDVIVWRAEAKLCLTHFRPRMLCPKAAHGRSRLQRLWKAGAGSRYVHM